MKGARHLVGIPLALLACAGSVALTLFLSRAPEPPVAPAPPPPPVESASRSSVIESIALDLKSRKSLARLRLSRAETGPRPDRVWVAVSFFTADGARAGAWASEPVELKEPFASSDSATVTATLPCGWLAESSAPQSGYYARAHASTESANDALRQARQPNFDIATAVPVLVQNAGGRAGRR